MMRWMAVALCAVVLLSGCDRAKEVAAKGGYVEDGVRYKGRVSSSKEDRAAFTVSVRRVERNPRAGAEAARVEATRYCIKQYGTSDITWLGQSPDDDRETLTLDGNGAITMQGRCATW